MKQTATHYSALRQIIGCCLFFLAAHTTNAQTRGTVEVIKDPRIDTLAARRLEAARGGGSSGSSAGSTISSDGFRVQFFFGSNRTEAYAAQTKFQSMYPNMRTYINYLEPNFRVRGGDFRTRLEATKFLQELRPAFHVVFIIPEKINPPVQ